MITIEILDLFIYTGIIAAGVSGALIGINKELDLFGIITLAVATALGGGMIRDVLIGDFPPVAFREPYWFLASVAAALFTMKFYKRTYKLKNILMVSDAIGLGVFTAIGADAALSNNMKGMFIVLSMGLITGIGGGIIRDVFSREIPFVFRKEIYAVASIAGALSFYLLYDHVHHIIAFYSCLAVTFAVRVLSVMYNLDFPAYRRDSIRKVKKSALAKPYLKKVPDQANNG